MKTRVAVLVSGRGSNLGALIEAARVEGFPGEIALVVSDGPEAGGLALARAQGVAAMAVDRREFRGDREGHEAAIDAALVAAEIGFVCLAGYMRRLTAFLVGRWAGRMINIHPSLLPAFPGLHTHERAVTAGVAVHGCSVHWVTEGLDEGPILGQAAVAVRSGDDAATLGARVLAAEHQLYPAVLRMVLGGGAAEPDAAVLMSLLPGSPQAA